MRAYSFWMLDRPVSSFRCSPLPAAGGELNLVCRGWQENIGDDNPRFTAFDQAGKVVIDTQPTPPAGEVYHHRAALRDLLVWLRDSPDLPDVIAVGHRVVHGGEEYSDPQMLTPEIIARLETFVPLAPLHQPHNLAGIHPCHRRDTGPGLPQVACVFDTAFHFTHQPELAQRLPCPATHLPGRGVRRYGFLWPVLTEYIAGAAGQGHGHSGEPLRWRRILAVAPACARWRQGNSVASTMGFTAVEGLPMGTRSGSLDPGVLLYLIERHGMGVRDLTNLLCKQSGLLGLSGVNIDMRELLASADPNAKLAVDYFSYRIARELGSLAAALGGLDALVFTGGIGEHAAAVQAGLRPFDMAGYRAGFGGQCQS